MFFGLFRQLMSSEAHFTAQMSSTVDPEFMRFVRKLMAEAGHAHPVRGVS